MTYTLKDWRAEGMSRFGEDPANWKFLCPVCGRVNTGYEFKLEGADANDMYRSCIGRHNGKGVDATLVKKGDDVPEYGCDWADWSETLPENIGQGNTVITYRGKEIDVFAFAEPVGKEG